MKRPTVRRLRPALLWCLLSWASSASWAECKLEQLSLPVRIVEHRPIVTLQLNGVEAPMLLDTGAFYSFISPATAARLNLYTSRLPDGMRITGLTGRVEARLTRVESVGLFGTQIKNVEFLVGGNEIGAGIMGILGRNFLNIADLEYDLGNGIVRYNFPKGDCDKSNLAYWAGDAPVVVLPLERDRSDDRPLHVGVRVNGRRMVALLDSGATTSMLTLSEAKRAGIAERDMTPRGRGGGAGSGFAQQWTAPMALFELGGEKISNNRIVVGDVSGFGQEMILGLDYFLSHRIYMSRKHDEVYITWNGGPVFLQQPSGTMDTRDAARPEAVAANDADGLARRGEAALAAGDHARALQDLDRACEIAPGAAIYFYARARVHIAMRHAGPATADLDEALRLDPSLAEARLRRAGLRAGMNDVAGMRADLSLLDANLPPAAAPRKNMGELLAHFGTAEEALRQFDLWADSHPRDAALASVLNSRCWLRARLNLDLSKALKDCERAVDLDDEEPSYADSLGWTYLRLGDARQARKAFDAAIALKPLPFSLYGRALALSALSDAAGARRDLSAARAERPHIDEELRAEGFDFPEAMARLAASGP